MLKLATEASKPNFHPSRLSRSISTYEPLIEKMTRVSRENTRSKPTPNRRNSRESSLSLQKKPKAAHNPNSTKITHHMRKIK
jgi:hypothetical protein